MKTIFLYVSVCTDVSAAVSASVPTGLSRSLQVSLEILAKLGYIKGVETGALGDSQQTSVREGSSLLTRELRG